MHTSGSGVFSGCVLRVRRLWLVLGAALALALIVLVVIKSDESGIPGIATPSWRGVVPGKTKQWDVIAIMGKPDEIHKCHLGDLTWDTPQILDRILPCFSPILTYEYKEVRPPRRSPATHEIRFRFATVWTVVEDVWGSAMESSPDLLTRLVGDYGPPETVTFSRRSPYVRAFLFCNHGVMVHANEVYASEVFYFVPVSTRECLDEFKDDIATEDPFPNPPFPRTGNPWPWLIDFK